MSSRTSRFLVYGLVLAGGLCGSTPAVAGFTDGDLYLLSTSYQSGGTNRSVVRIDPWTGSQQPLAQGLPNILTSNTGTYDPYRERLAFHSSGQTYLMDSDGQYEPLGASSSSSFYDLAPSGDGHIYTLRVLAGGIARWECAWDSDVTAAPGADGDPGRTPTALARGLAAPNPFNPRTTIAFDLPGATEATLTVHDLRGRVVRTLVSGRLAAGRQLVEWDGREKAGRAAASGVYLVRLSAADEKDWSLKVTLAK